MNDPRIGILGATRAATTWPTQNGFGGPFDYHPKEARPTTVPLGGDYFYVLPPGLAISPIHDQLLALVEAELNPPAPAVDMTPNFGGKRGVKVTSTADQSTQETTSDANATAASAGTPDTAKPTP